MIILNQVKRLVKPIDNLTIVLRAVRKRKWRLILFLDTSTKLPPSKFLERKKAWAKRMPTDPEKRNFGLKRIAEGNLKGTFRDTDITRELVHGINQVAGQEAGWLVQFI